MKRSPISFEKLHGLGNDFVLIDARRQKPHPLPLAVVKAIGDRKRGVGFDQLLLLTSMPHSKTIRLKIYNTDGSLAEMCGNGLRAAALHVWQLWSTIPKTRDTLNFLTDAGPRLARLMGSINDKDGVSIETEMGVPKILPTPAALLKDKKALPPSLLALPIVVNVGNPHVVLFLKKPISAGEAARWGCMIESHKSFPKRTNVEFCYIDAKKSTSTHARVITRVYERGVGLTEACGTGAVAVAAALVNSGINVRGNAVDVEFPGGTVCVEWNGTSRDQARLTGVAHHSFSGQWG